LNTDTDALSVVIPTLNEEHRLPSLLADLAGLGGLVREVLVVDGGSSDATVDIARRHGARVIVTERGRGPQLLAGGMAAQGDWLFFVHADCRLSSEAARALTDFTSRAADTDFAYFEFRLERRGPFSSFIEAGQRLRERVSGLVYGDQGLIVSRALYAAAGGHPAWGLMEDVGIVDRLRPLGHGHRLAAELTTSARRYEREGRVRAWLRNVALICGFRLGVSPARLGRWYRPEPRMRRPGQAVVAVFAKAPRPGRVKTRLAADVGASEAVRIYRMIGRETVDALRQGPWDTRVYVTPATAQGIAAVREWLGPEGVSFHTQSEGDLGHRMSSAIEECLATADAVVVVGSDIPGLDARAVQSALAALTEADVVLGPATDGGYYLVGMTQPHPTLFEDVPWSTAQVLPRTEAAIRRAGLRYLLLDPRTDADTLADVPEPYLAR
jgi:rSAM/selenodomain-associated transferase 2/rSAM/selenodomain-associated transferase 1